MQSESNDAGAGTSSAAGAGTSRNNKNVLEERGIQLGKVIGEGNYAKVRIGFSNEYGGRVAVKIITKLRAPHEYVQKFLPREIEAVKHLQHENVIGFYDTIETTHRVYIIMQLAENGTLLDYVRSRSFLEENQARDFFKQLISALEYIHSKDVVHRDIKGENILLDENFTLKLTDFGFARRDTRTVDHQVILSRTFCGSHAYASPEILKGVPYDPFLSDLWACGVVLYVMVFGRVPFEGSTIKLVLNSINTGLVIPKAPPVSAECKNLIINILAALNLRHNIDRVKADPWMQKNPKNTNNKNKKK